MNLSKTFGLLIVSLFSTGAIAATPAEVCDTIRSQDSFISTQKRAEFCDSVVSSSDAFFFDEAATQVCLTIAKTDSFNSTQKNAVQCLETIKNKSFNIDETNDCQDIANEDSFSSTQKSAIQCLDLGGRPVSESLVVVKSQKKKQAVTKTKKQQRKKLPENIAHFEGADIQSTVEIVQISKGDDTIYAVILKNVVIAGKSVGNIFLYPSTGKYIEAQEFSKIMNSVMNTKIFNELPVNKITINHLTDQDFRLSELMEALPADQDMELKVGRIKIEAVKSSFVKGKKFTLSYGMKVQE